MAHNNIPIRDVRQQFWQLAFIQSAAMGLPVILIGGQIAKKYSGDVAFLSVIAGNLILWLIALVMILMTPRHENAIENVENYLGKASKYLAATILTIAFLGWFMVQTKFASDLLKYVFKLNWSEEIRLGSALGLITALLSMGGIRFIKWFTCICFPFLFFYLLFITMRHGTTNSNMLPNFQTPFSILTIMIVVVSILPGIVNLPTFFRHSRSRAHSIGGLSLMMALNCAFQISGIFLQVGNMHELAILNLQTIPLTLFVVLSLMSVNFVNIYFAGAAWEAVIHQAPGPKGYAVFGLIGVLFFCALQASPPMEFVESLVNSFIASLGAVLLIAFLIKLIYSHRVRPRNHEKQMCNLSWGIGCATSFFLLVTGVRDATLAVVWGLMMSLFTFLLILFIEESYWATKKLIAVWRKK